MRIPVRVPFSFPHPVSVRVGPVLWGHEDALLLAFLASYQPKEDRVPPPVNLAEYRSKKKES